MGAKMAPAYANIFMAELEEKLLDNYVTKPILWKRYIDDILCIWPGLQSDFKQFIDYLNKAHPTIKFTYKSSYNSIDFLDITIYKGDRYRSNHTLDIKPHFKKTNKFQYLEYTSANPRQTFASLIKGELTRLLRACSSATEYQNVQEKMYMAFRDRGYPAQLIVNVQESIPFHHRERILNTSTKRQSEYVVVEYTPDLDIKKLRSIIEPQPLEEEYVPRPCLSLKQSDKL